MSLFERKEFISHAGLPLTWKVECDALTDEDWGTLAFMIYERVGNFSAVEGVPRGGLKLANALEQYKTESGPLLIVDDVCTTGKSLEDQRMSRHAIGFVVFCRDHRYLPRWCGALWVNGHNFS